MLKLIPWQENWATAQGESGAPLLDIKAIYRRPQYDREAMVFIRDRAGFLCWDLTGGLPVTSHAKWVTRGFRYVTLSTRSDLMSVAVEQLSENDVTPLRNWAEYVQNRRTDGPWDAAVYLADMAAERAVEIEELERDIREFGPDRAESLRRRDDPEYRIPQAFIDGIAKVDAPPVAGSQVTDAPPMVPVETPTTTTTTTGLSVTELQALSRAKRKTAAGKALTPLESAVMETATA